MNSLTQLQCPLGPKPYGENTAVHRMFVTVIMRNLLLILLVAASGCAIHEPSYQIIYTPDKPSTNMQSSLIMPLNTASTGTIEAPECVQQQARR
jgi:hypothetical protein